MRMAESGACIIGAASAAKRSAKPPRPAFSYFDKGSMATIGRARAVAEVAGLKMHGLLAWLAWLFVHVLLLVFAPPVYAHGDANSVSTADDRR